MPRLMITLPTQTAQELARIAFDERRDPRDQAALFVEQALAAKHQPQLATAGSEPR